MSVYKVIQDIEAEDKFLGPLTLKQFIFAGITAVSLYLSFIFITKHLWFLVVPFLPIIGVGGFLAFPWGRDQPTEVWLLGKLRFMIKPRRRIWDQSGVQELVTITAPKHIEMQYTNNLTQGEVKSRLRALADTIDSRGWAVKNVNVNLYTPQNLVPFGQQYSDRLVDISTLPQEVPTTEILPSDDIMDPRNNPLAQQLDQMITTSSATHREAAIKRMETVRAGDPDGTTDTPGLGAPPPNYWFVNTPDPSQTPAGFVQSGAAANDVEEDTDDLAANLTPEEQALLDQLHKEQSQAPAQIHGHMKVIQPLSKQKKASAKPAKTKPIVVEEQMKVSEPPKPVPVTPAPDPAILALALNNDRDVASLAREANALQQKDQPNEVVIRLH